MRSWSYKRLVQPDKMDERERLKHMRHIHRECTTRLLHRALYSCGRLHKDDISMWV